jgi:hypothetical protein
MDDAVEGVGRWPDGRSAAERFTALLSCRRRAGEGGPSIAGSKSSVTTALAFRFEESSLEDCEDWEGDLTLVRVGLEGFFFEDEEVDEDLSL